MVQVIENRSVVSGETTGEVAEGPQAGWLTVPVRVVASEPVEGYPDLLSADLPRELTALVPRELWESALADRPTWRAEVELAGPGRLRVRSAG